jgi:hypothetical protein
VISAHTLDRGVLADLNMPSELLKEILKLISMVLMLNVFYGIYIYIYIYHIHIYIYIDAMKFEIKETPLDKHV